MTVVIALGAIMAYGAMTGVTSSLYAARFTDGDYATSTLYGVFWLVTLPAIIGIALTDTLLGVFRDWTTNVSEEPKLPRAKAKERGSTQL